jgi:hypothetical protein
MKWVWTILALLYALSPYDILPDFLLGWGWLDDIVVLGLLYAAYYASGLRRRPSSWYTQTGKTAGRTEQNGRQAPGVDDEPAGPRSPWEILELEPGARPEQIRQAYRRLAATYHPDKMAHLGEDFRKLAETRFKEIQEAYQELKPD